MKLDKKCCKAHGFWRTQICHPKHTLLTTNSSFCFYTHKSSQIFCSDWSVRIGNKIKSSLLKLFWMHMKQKKNNVNRLNGASWIECNLRMGEQGHILGSCMWPNSPNVSHSSVVRACNRYLEGHGFDSCWGLRKFFFWVFRLDSTSLLFCVNYILYFNQNKMITMLSSDWPHSITFSKF